MTERQLTTIILKYLKMRYPNGIYFKICDKFTSGIPDILGCIQGKFIAIEVKAGKANPTLMQKHILTMIKFAYGIAGVCRHVKDVEELLKKGGL